MSRRWFTALIAVALAATFSITSTPPAQAYVPAGDTLYQLPASESCLKGRGNCVVYPKSVQLPSGRILAAFEKATVVDYPAPDSIGGAVGETVPIWKSDDDGTTWQPLTEVASPAALTTDPALDRYSSNWTNPYLYVLPRTIGDLSAGTVLLATVVSGEDEFFRDNKQRDPNWTPTNDGDRRDVALALYAGSADGSSWRFLNIIATGGWQGGSAGAGGVNIAAANTTRQQDPVWEPHLDVRGDRLVAYYSDENDYLSVSSSTGIPVIDPANATARDSGAQILAHKTWDGRSTAPWSQPVVDVAGDTFAWNGGQQIGGGRPGMTTIAATNDGRYMLTFEYFGGGDNVRYKISDDPLRFFADGDPNGQEIRTLPVDAGSRTLSTGGSPVLVALPDGRIAYNAAGSGSIWINDGASTGRWTEYQTTLGGGYSRNMQYVSGTGRLIVLQSTWGGPTTQPVVRHADVDLGRSAGEYVQLVNRRTGQVAGTGNSTNDANIGNSDQPDVKLETIDSVTEPATQFWHVTAKAGGGVTLLNKSGGRAASIWTGQATPGQRIGQWVDNSPNGTWNVIPSSDGFVRFQTRANTSLYLTGGIAGGGLTLATSSADGSQEWRLTPEAQAAGNVTIRNANSTLCSDVWRFNTADRAAVNQGVCTGGTNQMWRVVTAGSDVRIVNVHTSKCLEIYGFSTSPGAAATQYTCNDGANQRWTRTTSPFGGVTFRNVASGLCLEIFASSTANGATLGQWSCNGGANQRWLLG